jgi:hypothetical protein
MMKANTARTIQIRNEMMSRKSVFVRGEMTPPVMSPIERPRFRRLIASAAMSWTAPMNSVPSATQRRAGSQPQMTASAGPTMGAAPAIDV